MTDSRPRVVLVRPRGGANVGSVCRALMNMGGGELYVVDGRFDVDHAARMAVHARPLLDARREVQSLREAIAGCSVVVGTTARGGPYRDRARDVRDVARDLVAGEHGGLAAAALVFGPEDTGLTNDDVAACHQLAFIPASEAYPSLNLAQAVMVVLYELHRARLDDVGISPAAFLDRLETAPPADAGDLEDTFAALEQLLLDVGFLSTDNPKHIMATVRSLCGRAALDARELRILRGIIRQMRWYVEGGREVALAKQARGEKLK